MCCDAASTPTVITLAWSHSACGLHKIDLVHTCNNSLARLSDWNLQGSQQSEVRMKKKKKNHLLLKCSHLSNGSILEDGRFWLSENVHAFLIIFVVSCLLNQQGCIWPLHLIFDGQSREFASLMKYKGVCGSMSWCLASDNREKYLPHSPPEFSQPIEHCPFIFLYFIPAVQHYTYLYNHHSRVLLGDHRHSFVCLAILTAPPHKL